jgi:eukaryotic-like serine/threonine-protein kinase
MTPERWRQVGELFKASVRIDPAGREPWLRDACGGDDDLRAEVGRLLALDERADRVGFLTATEATDPLPDRTASWRPRAEALPPEPGPAGRPGATPADDTGGFTPRQAIAPTGRHTISEPPDVVRARLRVLPMIYILILGGLFILRRAFYGPGDAAYYRANATVILSLVGLVVLLWSRWPIPLAGLKALELGMVGLLAGLFAWVQYRVTLESSVRGDLMRSQFVLKNVVLLTAVLILTYGLYVPKGWRRTAVVVGPLALFPFATLAVLALRHPEAMAWLGEGWLSGPAPRAFEFTFDGMILIILAVGATYGARTISWLRREVAEARRLGQYHLRRLLGAGGMGEVYLAEHLLLKRPCAVKLIRPACATNPRALERFEREVRLTAALSHPNIVEIYDYGRAEDGTYYYVMEYLNGLSLAELVERHGVLPPGRVVYLLRQVCEALGEAHAAGLIHRDIKPSNIFAARRGAKGDVAKLLDFGLVLSRAGPHAAHLSGEGQVLGTPLYMSPEQVRGGRELDGRSDLYSLGAVAYYLLTGRPPFDGESGIGVMIAHASDPVVPPSRGRPDVPEDLERVVLRCLAKDPAERFPDAEGLEQALGECACARDWDRDRAARWWQGADAGDHELGRPRGGSNFSNHD